MTQPGLVVAIVASGIFGAALLWLGTYYLHRYIHKQCLELDHWFHWHAKREDYGREKTKNASTSPMRRGKSPRESGQRGFESKERRTQSRRRHRSPKDRSRGRREHDCYKSSPRLHARDRLEESSTESPEESLEQRPIPRPMDTIERRWERRPNADYHSASIQAHRPRIEAPDWQQQMTFQMPPQMAIPMQYPMFASAVAPMVFPVAYHPGYEQQYANPAEQTPVQSSSDRGAQAAGPSPQLGPRTIDFIMECDELPPMLRKGRQSPQSSDDEPSGEEIDGLDNDDIQQIPRAYIPRSTPRAAASHPQAIAVPQASFWNMMPDTPPGRRTRKARYAPPCVNAAGQRWRLKNAVFETYEPVPRQRSDDRTLQVTRKSPRRSESRQPGGIDRGHDGEPPMSQVESEVNDALAQEAEEVKSEEDRDHVDAGQIEAEIVLSEEPIYPEQNPELQQCLEPDPVLLGMASPAVEEHIEPLTPAPAHFREGIPSLPLAPASSRGPPLNYIPASPSSLVSSLHRSAVIQSRALSGQGSQQGSEIDTRVANGYEENSPSIARGSMKRNGSEALVGGASVILSSLEGWEANP